MAVCYSCYGQPKATFSDGFKRERVVCDKYTEQNILSLYLPSLMERVFYGYPSGHGYIKYENVNGKYYFCSVLCLHFHSSIYKITENMYYFDKKCILEQFKKEVNHYNKDKMYGTISLESEPETEELSEPLNACQLENEKELIQEIKTDEYTLLKEQLDALQLENKEQKEMIQANEHKWKEFEKKQKELDKLRETTKAKDREIFCLIARNMELEKRLS